MQQRKSDVAYESSYIMTLSAFRHSEDQRHNCIRLPHFNKAKSGYTSDKTRAFAQRWLGASA